VLLSSRLLFTQKCLDLAAATAILYDFFLTFETERTVVWGQTGAKVNFTRLLWVAHRYGNIINYFLIAPSLNYAHLCRLNIQLSFLCTIFSQFTISCFFIIRTWALWGQSRIILGVLIFAYLSCLGLQLYPAIAVFAVDMSEGSRDPLIKQYLCWVSSDPLGGVYYVVNRIRRIGWLGSLVFDALVTVLTFFRTWRYRKTGTRLLGALFSEGVSYFCAVLFLNFVLFATYDTLPLVNSPLLQRMTQVLTVIMVSHLFLNLKMHAMRENLSQQSEVVSSGGRMYLDLIGLDNTLVIDIAHE